MIATQFIANSSATINKELLWGKKLNVISQSLQKKTFFYRVGKQYSSRILLKNAVSFRLNFNSCDSISAPFKGSGNFFEGPNFQKKKLVFLQKSLRSAFFREFSDITPLKPLRSLLCCTVQAETHTKAAHLKTKGTPTVVGPFSIF